MDRNRTREEGGSRRRGGASVNKYTGFDDTSTEGRTPYKTQATTYLKIKLNGFNGHPFIYLHTVDLSFLSYRMKKSQSQKLCHPTFLPSTYSPSLV